MNKYSWVMAGVIVFFIGWLLVRDKVPRMVDNVPYNILAYGETTLDINEEAEFENIKITPLEVTEDSRCPQGVLCIWAGTLKVRVLIDTGSDTTTLTVELNKSLQVDNFEIKLLSAEPVPKASSTITPSDYEFIFKVEKVKSPATGSVDTERCYVGGCSSQICSDQEGLISTCEYREEYACYRTAKCERQTNGHCGWTETSELKMCLANPPQL